VLALTYQCDLARDPMVEDGRPECLAVFLLAVNRQLP